MLDWFRKPRKPRIERREKPEEVKPGYSGISPKRQAALRRSKSGIPNLEKPELPAGCTAVLIACTTTGRAYWVVFERTGSDWRWKLNLSAIPSDGKTGVGLDPRPSGEVGALIPMGGRDWGDWRCPGCGQQQKAIAGGNYVHRTHCACGTPCCLGPGGDEANLPRCPNCGATIHTDGSLIKTGLLGSQPSNLVPDNTLRGDHRKQIDD
jgi:hypothetical protein